MIQIINVHLFIATATFLIALSFIISEKLSGIIDPISLSLYRFVFSSIVLSPIIFLQKKYRTKIKQNFKIEIKKMVLFDTELSRLFEKNSLKNLQSDIHFVNLSKIKQLNNKHLKNKIKNSTYEKLYSSNIFTAFCLCTKKGKMVLKGSKDEPNLCYDEKNKEKTHRKILKVILNFFNKLLF